MKIFAHHLINKTFMSIVKIAYTHRWLYAMPWSYQRMIAGVLLYG